MAEPKTKKTGASVADFVASITDTEKQKDARALIRLMQRVTGEKPKMWGTSIVGFGEYSYRYASGREADWPATGFSPRAQSFTVYCMADFGKLGPLLAKLGKHSTAKSCLYIRRLSDVDPVVLEAIVEQAMAEARALSSAGESSKPAPKAAAPRKKKAASKSTARRSSSKR